ncbi:hypothetical protein [Negativibacillus massiliensis]|uniref:hypothetical protein n=1 Tax=Negativibacillus massiliensis TaxID=1871035 RepID=UPI003AF23E16
MSNYIIKPMQTESEMDGKGHVHYQSYQEAYTGLMDAEYLSSMSEKSVRKSPTNGRKTFWLLRMERK